MTGDLISRKALISKMYPYGMPDGGNYGINARAVRDAVMNAPAVEAEPVVHAHWVGTQYDGYADGCPVYDLWECSECREEHESEGDPPPYERCPHCGAHMDEEASDGT